MAENSPDNIRLGRRAAWLILAVLVTACLALAVVSVMVYNEGGANSPFETFLIYGVFLPLSSGAGTAQDAQFLGFTYELAVDEGPAFLIYSVALVLDPADATDAPVLVYAKYRYKSRPGGPPRRPDFTSEARIRLTPAQAEAIGPVIRTWQGPREKVVGEQYGAALFTFGEQRPRLDFFADMRTVNFGGDWTYEGWETFLSGADECSKARPLLQAINQALPRQVATRHPLPLPPLPTTGKGRDQ